MNRLRKRLRLDEEGQAIVIVALFLTFVFLAMAALAIDGTIVYLRRRQLQNIADAAALTAAIELNLLKTDAEAYQAAMDSIASNEGHVEWYSTSDTPDPGGYLGTSTNVGTGLDLAQGIEISASCDVRVALRWSDIGTYFAQFVGRDLLQVGARAHAGCNRAGGLQPIAVKRFGDQGDWDLSATGNTNSWSVYCDDCDTQQSLAGQGNDHANDFLRVQGSDVITQWPGWPGSAELYQSPSPHADLASGAPGRDYFFLGGGVSPSVGTTSYAGLVNLDIRHISAPPVEYYNGVAPSTNSNTLKDYGEHYIRQGYCCDIPLPGDQVAMYNGNSTAFAAQAFQQTYAISDVVAVIIYDGHVFNTPNLELTGETPNFKSTHPTTTTLASNTLTYTLTLTAKDGFQSAPGGVTMNVEGLAGFATWSFSPTSSPVVGRSGITQRTITLHVTPTTTTVGTTTHVITGTRMFYISAIDDKVGGTDLRRYWAGIATIGDEVNGIQRDLPAVTATPNTSAVNYPFTTVIRDGPATTYDLDLDVWNVGSDQSVTVNAGSLPTGFSWVGAPPWTKTTKWSKHAGAGFNIKFKVDSTAAISATHTIPLTVSAPGLGSQTFNLYILVEEAQTTVKDYVEILGYAALQITGYYNAGNLIDPTDPTPPPANAVRGRIVSQLWGDPSEMIYGRRARLIPWEQ